MDSAAADLIRSLVTFFSSYISDYNHGAVIPGCPETFQSSPQSEHNNNNPNRSKAKAGSHRQEDRRQKRSNGLSQGDIVATPVGGAKYWFYNDGDTQLVMVSLLDISRTFYLGSNPLQGKQLQESSPHGRRGTGQESSSNNILNGFDDQLLAEAFGVRSETARRLRGQNDNRGIIVRVENEVKVIRPPRVGEENNQQRTEMKN